MKTFGVTDYKKTRHPKSVADGWTDGGSGPITRPAFAKATQVKFSHLFNHINLGCLLRW